MSESSGPQTTGIDTAFRLGSAGRSIPGVTTRIDKPDPEGNGEICMKRRNTSMGYLQQEDKTIETIDEQGWIRSGGIGKFEEGYLLITGRLKERLD